MKVERYNSASKNKILIIYQQKSYKDMDIRIFGFISQKTQINAIYMLFSKQKDLFLLTITRLTKSLIFELKVFFGCYRYSHDLYISQASFSVARLYNISYF